jgi:osmoprotectant transport system ATP-binding protein
LILPDSGTVLVQSRPTSDWSPFELRRRIGYVMQEVGLFPHMTVADNVSVVPRLNGWALDRTAARVSDLLTLVGLPPDQYADRRPDQLSGGQRQRVGVARALAADPPILLMDEPFGALDPVTRAEMHREFRRIQEQVRKTIVIVTHDMAEAFALATRVGVLADGTLAAFDAPRAVARSTDPRVRPLLEPLLEATAAFGDPR